MIQMTRVRLVNWHNFVNDTLDFKQVTYMIGINAVGKTTILDAIRYCLTTKKEFNALGNRKSGRTLQGSIHGKQRGNNIYSRPGHTVSYIGIEFLDTTQNASFVISVRVESENPEEELRHVKQTWYITPSGFTLEDLPYIDPAVNRPTSSEQFSLKNGRMPAIENQSQARDKICRCLGIGTADSVLGKKFAAVFPMGTSLEDITNFKSFIHDYILPPPAIDLDVMQQDERELEHLEEVLLEAQDRSVFLEHIVNASSEARQKQRDALLNQGFVLYADYQDKSTTEERILSALEQCNQKIEQLEAAYQTAENAAEQAHNAYVQAMAQSQQSEESLALAELRNTETQLHRELSDAQKHLKDFLNARSTIEDALSTSRKMGFEWDDAILPSAIQSMPQRRREELQMQLEHDLKSISAQLDEHRINLAREAQDTKSKLTALHKKIEALSDGKLIYPDNNCAQHVKNKINQMLSDQGMEPDAKILCDILYMTDPTWQDCVEACLGGRRFDILVPSKHYPVAKYAYESMGNQVGRVSLLDSPALERDLALISSPQENALATKVSSENQLAKAYISDALGDIICCDKSDDLENHRHSATRDLLRHYPYRLARLKKAQAFIGKGARAQQLEEAKQEFIQLTAASKALNAQISCAKSVYDQFQIILCGDALTNLCSGWDSETIYEQCLTRHNALKKKINELENDPILLGMYRHIEFLRQEHSRKDREKQEIYAQKRSAEDHAVEYLRMQQSAIDAAQSAEQAWQEYIQQQPSWQEEILKRYENAAKKHDNPADIAQYQRNRQQQFERALQDFTTTTLIPLQQQYNQRYTCDLSVGLDSLDEYQELFDHLTNVDIERHITNLQTAKQRCKVRFRKEILYRLKDDILNARRQFTELNRIMEKLAYGEELYHFTLAPSEDPTLAAFYRLITHISNEPQPEAGSLDALAYQEDPLYEAQIEDLMEQILADLRQAAQLRQEGKKVPSTELSSYVDYRRYLSYDIQVTNSVTNETVPISAVSGDSSGGENQVPFYIAICASLLQIYQKCQNSIRLVLLDEAFSKMTSDRIKPMMQMLRSMNLQVVLITTVEKASAICPYCDITHSIVKLGLRNSVRPFYLEEVSPL